MDIYKNKINVFHWTGVNTNIPRYYTMYHRMFVYFFPGEVIQLEFCMEHLYHPRLKQKIKATGQPYNYIW